MKRLTPISLIPLLLIAFTATSCDDMLSSNSGAPDPTEPDTTTKQRFSGSWTLQQSGTMQDLEDVHFINEQTGWATGNDVLLKTTDGGVTWEPQENLDLNMTGVHFTDSLNGWAVGGNVIQHTEDGGETWQRQGQALLEEKLDNPKEYLRGIYFATPDSGWAIADGASGRISTILSTCDGGQTWHVQYESDQELERGDMSKGLDDIFFLNAKEGWAVGEAQPVTGPGGSPPASKPFLLHTTDGGQTWTSEISEPVLGGWYLTEVFFLDQQHGWMIGRHPSITDQGYPDPPLSSTNDGGETWNAQVLDAAGDVQFVTPDVGWVVGSTIVHTTDGGQTWEEQEMPTDQVLNTVDFVNECNGWAVGTEGTIAHYSCN